MTDNADKITEAREWLDRKHRGTTMCEGHPLKTLYALLDRTNSTPVNRELLESLRELRSNIGAASLVRNPVGKRIRDRADAAIANADASTSLTDDAPDVSLDDVIEWADGVFSAFGTEYKNLVTEQEYIIAAGIKAALGKPQDAPTPPGMVLPEKDLEIFADLIALCPDDLWMEILAKHYAPEELSKETAPIRKIIEGALRNNGYGHLVQAAQEAGNG